MTYDIAQVFNPNHVQSMIDCDKVATRAYGAPVHFTAHPKLTRIAQIWAGTCRWKPRATLLKKIAARLRAHNGFTTRDRRMYSREHAMITLGFDSLHWRYIRRIRATSSYVTHTIYRLNRNRFPL